MSKERRVLSLLIVFHLVAVGVATVPRPSELNAVVSRRTPPSDWLAFTVTPFLDRLATLISKVQPWLYSGLSPFRGVTRVYSQVSVRQDWRMFANPQTDDRYIRLRYYADDGTSGLKRYVELILPVASDESHRYFRGKAIRNALGAYLRKDFRYTPISDQEDSTVYEDLVPIVRYYRERFREAHDIKSVVRTEFWYGAAPIPPPGERPDDEARARRRQLLAKYSPRPTRWSLAPSLDACRDAGVDVDKPPSDVRLRL